MEAIKTKGVAHKGILSVQVPKEFEERELEVIILSTIENEIKEVPANEGMNNAEEVKKFNELPGEERLKILEQYKGTAKYPEFPFNKYDVYDQ
ncbi:MAG: hypothetical protein ACR2KZ_07710 [Segetibacter sp.]